MVLTLPVTPLVVMRRSFASISPIHCPSYTRYLRAASCIHRQTLPFLIRSPVLTSRLLPSSQGYQCCLRPKIPSNRQCFHSTPSPWKDHHFDTLKFTQRLQRDGLTESQSAALLNTLQTVLSESVQNLTRSVVPREDFLKTSYTQKIDFNALRSELLASDTSESTLTRSTHDRLQNEVVKMGQRLRDEVERTKSGVKLDLNLERGRGKEEREALEMKLREIETRIESEVAGLRERVEGVKFDTVRWLAGVVTGTMALLLGAWRLFM